jgi:hypothetical protein
MHNTMEAAGNSAALFMISWSFISQIILALLLALLIDTYSDEDDGEGEEEEEAGPGIHCSPCHGMPHNSINVKACWMRWRAMGLADLARHVVGCLFQEMRVPRCDG